MKHEKLTKDEAKRLREYIDKNGGQEPVAVGWGISSATLSRSLNGDTAPSSLLRRTLAAVGVLKA